MDGYLLLARCPQDDIPLGLYARPREASIMRAALAALKQPDLLGVVNRIARRLLTIDVSKVITLDVVRFRNHEPLEVLFVAEDDPEDEAEEG